MLLVDDEVGITRAMQLYLEKTGKYDVEVESEGRSVLERARAFRPDLIVLDIILPDMDGTTIAEMISQDPVLGHIPIVFLTATMSREEVGVEGKVIGERRVLAKPVSPKTVIQCIDEVLGV